jgi:maltooligosyltrehalose trehalohydrolase
MKKINRKYPIGAETDKAGTHFRVWASNCRKMELVLQGDQTLILENEGNGYFSLQTEARAGQLYGFRLNGQSSVFPDPASRSQPMGPHGNSCIVDPLAFHWSDGKWKGISTLKGHVLYEMHIGTFTQEGTWKAATHKLHELADLGITLIEMMPIADFPGEYGWGYDGVNLFAPTHLYGSINDLKEFINQAHLHGIGVILDVVYNHFGPEGNYLEKFSKEYVNENSTTDWGCAVNFDAAHSRYVRDYFITNALYWIEEYRLDGLRLDATQNIYDHSHPHILAEMVHSLKNGISKDRSFVLIAENESQDVILIQSQEKGGYGLDAVWNDDFHHSAMVRLIGRAEAYYSDYKGSAQEIISSLKYGYLYQGQYYKWQKKHRGTPSLELSYENYIIYLQNHDQIANYTQGLRIFDMCDATLLRVLTTVMILSPQIPLLFQGQEFACTSPFFFFADQQSELKGGIREGRKIFLNQFPSFSNPDMHCYFPDPGCRENFLRCKLNWNEKKEEKHAAMFQCHKDLIRLRREDTIFTSPLKIDGSIFSNDLFLIRWFGGDGNDRLLICNFGVDFLLSPIPEPLLAPPKGKKWKSIFSSQHPDYFGFGMPSLNKEEWNFPGHTALVLKPIEIHE